MMKRSSSLSTDKIKGFAGRVFIASEALENGLIDDIMKESDALSLIKTIAKIPAYVGANNEGGNSSMNLQEFLEQNPEAKAEYDALVASARADGASEAEAKNLDERMKAYREQVSEIVALSGGTMSKNALACIAEGKDAKEFALLEMKEQKKKNASAKQELGSFEAGSEIVKGVDTDKSKPVFDAAFEKVFPKKEGK
ncbi:MAG: hypothetical protein EOM15_16780 [Spirochaetia bacterium]|nr:hypothetical protein [Spirochaetia bacterium]